MYSRRHSQEEKFSYGEQTQKYASVDVDLPAWCCGGKGKKKGLPDWGRYNILNQDESVIPLHHESDLKASSLYFIFI